MSNTTYLVVKTGKSGAKLEDLYSVSVDGIKLLGEGRLKGSMYQGIVKAVKMKGEIATFTVFKHRTKNVDVLLKDYQKSMLMLRNDIKWIPVARIDMEQEDLEKVAESAVKIHIDDLEKRGIIEIIKRKPFTYHPTGMNLSREDLEELCGKDFDKWHDYIMERKYAVEGIKWGIGEEAAKAVVDFVKML